MMSAVSAHGFTHTGHLFFQAMSVSQLRHACGEIEQVTQRMESLSSESVEIILHTMDTMTQQLAKRSSLSVEEAARQAVNCKTTFIDSLTSLKNYIQGLETFLPICYMRAMHSESTCMKFLMTLMAADCSSSPDAGATAHPRHRTPARTAATEPPYGATE